jgi:uncharacterized protein YwgA
MKTEQQKISQIVLLLHILAKDASILGNLKLQKEVFLNEFNLTKSNCGGLYYKFFRYQFGPYSSNLTTDFQWLRNVGLVHKSTYKPTERGQYLADFIEGTIRSYHKNARIFDAIDKITEKCKPYTGQQLMNIVYRLSIEPEDMPGRNLKIRDIPMFTDLLAPEYREFKIELDIPENIVEDIRAEVAFDEEEQKRAKRNLPKLLKESEEALRQALDP